MAAHPSVLRVRLCKYSKTVSESSKNRNYTRISLANDYPENGFNFVPTERFISGPDDIFFSPNHINDGFKTLWEGWPKEINKKYTFQKLLVVTHMCAYNNVS